MNKIKFCKNWNNKLDKESFTTIRKYTEEKERYYESLLGKELEVHLNDKFYCVVTLEVVSTRVLKDVPVQLLYEDTGLCTKEDIEELFKLFGIKREDKALILYFKRSR